MQNDQDYLNKIEEIIQHKREADPLNQEATKLFNKMFPVEQFEDVFLLGYVYALSDIKNNVSKYLCKDCNEYINALIKAYRNNEVMNKYLNKFIK
jgi:hypothetical protein